MDPLPHPTQTPRGYGQGSGCPLTQGQNIPLTPLSLFPMTSIPPFGANPEGFFYFFGF